MVSKGMRNEMDVRWMIDLGSLKFSICAVGFCSEITGSGCVMVCRSFGAEYMIEDAMVEDV